jgi:hypothetical protein
MWHSLLYSLAIVLSCLAAAVGGFSLGRSGGPDVAGAANKGALAGFRDGARAGLGAGQAAGYRSGYHAAYHHIYARAYRTAYNRALGQ